MKAHSIDDLRRLARRRLPKVIFDSVDGGADDEVSLMENREALRRIRFVPLTLADVSRRDQSVEIFGTRISSPMIVAPMGLLGLLRPGGEIAIARAASAATIPFVLATGANTSIERLAEAAAGGRRWFQLYPFRDERINRSLLGRAASAGYEALVVTTDTQTTPKRERDLRNGFSIDWRPSLRLALDLTMHPRWCWAMAGAGGLPRFETIVAEMKGDPDARATAAFFLSERDWNVGWDAIGNLRRLWSGPLLLKGLLDVGEARRAADLGVDGIVLSNHGGRNLDGVVAPIDVLPGVADAVGHRLSVLIDSGIRRGTDVVKALSLGAKAVLLGRPVAWGLAAGGEAGVSRALSIMREEIDRALAFLGCAHAEDLRPFYVCRSDRPNVEEREEAAAGTR